MTADTPPAWIVTRMGATPPVFECRVCKQTEVIVTPATAVAFVAQADAFRTAHRGCGRWW